VLLGGLDGLASRVLVTLLVVKLQARKQRILEAHVHAAAVEEDAVRLVGLKRRRDGEVGLRVAIQDVHKLLLLARADHHSTS
jgi:hypothetical protein